MNKIKYIGVILLVFFLSLNAFSQTEHIILWDVTYSMKGCCADGKVVTAESIWEETKDKIIQQIENISANGRTSIYILPFQNPSDNPAKLDWKVVSNINNVKKTELKKWVREFEFDFDGVKKRSTNVCEALNTAYDKIDSFSNSKQIILALYTDGMQTKKEELRNCEYDYRTCLNEQVGRFCDLCDELDRNRLYVLKLKDYTSNIKINCDCVIEVETPPIPTYRSKPHTSNQYFLEENIVGEKLIIFDDVLGNMPVDLLVTAVSSNPNIIINKNVNVNENGDFTIVFQKVTVGENQREFTKISFKGASDDNVEITIEPLSVEIENVMKSTVVIQEIKIK